MRFAKFPGPIGKTLLLGALAGLPFASNAEWGLNMTPGVTPYSHEIYDLHMFILGICVVIGLIVFATMFVAMIKFRKSQGAKPAAWHESTMVEMLWTIVPFVILVAVAVPATKALIMMEDVSNADMTIKVTGYQWKWHYQYVDDGIAYFSTISQDSNVARQLDSGIDPKTVQNYLLDVDNRLVVPVNKKIRFLTTAGDVIHAWWVPALGWKRDAIPGYINESWATIEQPGVYRGQCAELCGKDHGFMPIVVEALSQEDYAAWVAKMQAATQQAGTQTSALPAAAVIAQQENGA